MIENADRLRELAREAVKVAAATGFVQATWQTLPIKVLWVVTEINEVHDVHYEPEKCRQEIADVALRTMGILHTVFPGWRLREVHLSMVVRATRWADRLWPMIDDAARAGQAWRKGNEKSVELRLCNLLGKCFDLANEHRFDLVLEMERTLDRNRDRPYLHGTLEPLG